MGLKMACKDLGTDCPFVAHGKNKEELMVDVEKHAKEVHSYTDAQLKDPKMVEAVKAAIKEE